MDWIIDKMDWSRKIGFFAHPYSFPSVYITYRIILTISVSTMSQERLNGLALLSIKEEMLIMTI